MEEAELNPHRAVSERAVLSFDTQDPLDVCLDQKYKEQGCAEQTDVIQVERMYICLCIYLYFNKKQQEPNI